VLQVNVRPSEAVTPQSGRPLVMMGDVRVLHVRVAIDENDVPRLALDEGDPGAFRARTQAEAWTRGVPPRRLKLRFVRAEPYVVPKRSLTGDNAERVDTRVMELIFAIDEAKAPVHLGEQLDVFIGMGMGGK
jgi:hypothetical protein